MIWSWPQSDKAAIRRRNCRRAAFVVFMLLGGAGIVAAPAGAQGEPDHTETDQTEPGHTGAGHAEAAEHYDQGRVGAALRIWRSLAEAGDAAAQVSLAGLYANGEVSGTRDYVRAAKWYRRAAAQGDVTAQINLGDIRARGLGAVDQDRVKAWVWFQRAASQGSDSQRNDWAARRAETVAAEMTPAQRKAAKARMEESETAP